MKKQTKMTILVLFLVVTMFGSSAAFLIVGGLAPPKQQEQQGQTTPTQFVVDGYLDFASHDNFLSRGYTLIEFHAPKDCCPDFTANVEALPAELEFQMVVQKIEDEDIYFKAESFHNRKQFNATTVLQVLFELCDVLASPPPDCAFRGNATR